MSTIDIEAMCSLANALSDSGIECEAQRFAAIFSYLDETGWQLTRKDQIIDEVVIADRKPHMDQELIGAVRTWPPPGIVNLFSIVAGQAKVILGITELKYAVKEGRPIVSARRPDEALNMWDDPVKDRKNMKFDGIEFNYYVDPLPF